MRLLAACLALFLAPAGAFILTDRKVFALEDEFFQDAARQVERLNSLYRLNPQRAKRMPMAAAIVRLREMGDGSAVAANACGGPDSLFRRLFDNVHQRCGSWSMLRRARWLALLSVLVTAVVFGLVLTARIVVQRYASREIWPGNWTMWFVIRGLPLLLVAQTALSLSGYGVVLQETVGKPAMTLAILALPFAALLLLERKLVLAYVEPQQLRIFRPTGVPRAEEGAEAPAAIATAAAPAEPPSAPRLQPRAGIGVARRRRGPDGR